MLLSMACQSHVSDFSKGARSLCPPKKSGSLTTMLQAALCSDMLPWRTLLQQLVGLPQVLSPECDIICGSRIPLIDPHGTFGCGHQDVLAI